MKKKNPKQKMATKLQEGKPVVLFGFDIFVRATHNLDQRGKLQFELRREREK